MAEERDPAVEDLDPSAEELEDVKGGNIGGPSAQELAQLQQQQRLQNALNNPGKAGGGGGSLKIQPGGFGR